MRDETRHPISFEITYTIEEEPSPHDDMVKNISEGGLCLLTREAIEVGSELEFTLTIGDKSYQLAGFSVWEKASSEINDVYEIGVQFDLDSQEVATTIVQLICNLHLYRKTIEIEEGRNITLHEAALEFKQGIKGNQT